MVTGGIVSADRWDAYCERLMTALRARLVGTSEGIAGLDTRPVVGAGRLLDYYERWDLCRAELQTLASQGDRRLRVLDEFGYRGYGVNRDLQGALRAFRLEVRAAQGPLEAAFDLHLDRLRRRRRGSTAQGAEPLEPASLLAALRRGRPPAARDAPEALDLAGYFEQMSRRTPWPVNTAIFQKLFLEMGRGSRTLMTGASGQGGGRSTRETKILAGRNFLDAAREAFSTLHDFLEIGVPVVQRIHWLLSRDLDPDAGRIRAFDFEDRNGVSVGEGHLVREMSDLSRVLEQTGASLHDTGRFLWDLARSYYMLLGIHPFRDSNGRTGRFFLNTLLLKKGLPPLGFLADEEVLALPRYGGTMEDLHDWLLRRLAVAIGAYRGEREKLRAMGLFDKPIYAVAFDAGVHFRQADDGERQLLEVRTRVYLMPDSDPRRPGLVAACRLAVPDEAAARALCFYCGLSDSVRGQWRRVLSLLPVGFSDEVDSDLPGVRCLEVGALLELDDGIAALPYLGCSVVSPGDGAVFSNQGLHFWTRLEKRARLVGTEEGSAERWAQPARKWLGEGRPVANAAGRISFLINGGVSLAMRNLPDLEGIVVVLELHRADGVRERYLTAAYPTSEWGESWRTWQTHRLPLFPFESAHGPMTFATVSFLLQVAGRTVSSQHAYKLATLEDAVRGETDSQDFCDPTCLSPSVHRVADPDPGDLQWVLRRLNDPSRPVPVKVLFTRGAPASPDHPVREIHRHIDWVVERQRADPRRRHTIRMASYDLDNPDLAGHLIWAREQGVDVECLADWHAVASFNRAESVVRMRRAGIPVHGVVRNTPGDVAEGFASMHAKFAVFDEEIVHSSSYNLHFHLWGGNWEHLLVVHSREAAQLHLHFWDSMLGGAASPLEVAPAARLGFHFGLSTGRAGGETLRLQDVVVREIQRARVSIRVCMFDLGRLVGRGLDGVETDVVEALIAARDRGVRVRLLLNGQVAHQGPLPEWWDKELRRPLKEPVRRLKDAWMEVGLVHYWESVHSPLHHKFAVFDGATVLAGSCNWYEPSVASDELLAVVRDPDLARQFEEEADLLERTLRLLPP